MNPVADVQPIVRATRLTKIFGQNSRATTAIRNVSFEAYPGELILFLGPSGSGKTTLLTLTAGFIRPTSGCVSLFGKDVGAYEAIELQRLRCHRIGFVFQNFQLLEPLTVEENVQLVLRFAGAPKKESHTRSGVLLRELAVEHLAHRFPLTLSQGEKQRVGVARAVANEPELILADEPTASLETRQGFAVITMLHEYARTNGACVIIASHDLRIKEFASRVLMLEDGMLSSCEGKKSR